MKRFKKEGAEGQEPTKAELAVLQVLWKQGPSTVRFVHDALNEGREAAQYTTTLKLMQLMTEKGMLLRDESSMKHVYSAALEEKGTKGQLLNRFIDTMYHGSVTNMMLALLGNEKTSEKDLQQVRDMLDEMTNADPSEGSGKKK
ncbi:MAG TPA: BlaI/MecI/CopY family transcriptional regulator [Puia sp.]|jgi:predicted transcriptional regulator